jgi:ABC-type polysaccharide/polyol phosphate transport system ATPase subunit
MKRRVADRKFKRKARVIHAVRGVDFFAMEGEPVGIIGPNGSGKSTFLAALSGLLPLDSGKILARSRPTLLGVGAALRRTFLVGSISYLAGWPWVFQKRKSRIEWTN